MDDLIPLPRAVLLGVLASELVIRRFATRGRPRWTIATWMAVVVLVAVDATLAGRGGYRGPVLRRLLVLTATVSCAHLLARGLARWMRRSPFAWIVSTGTFQVDLEIEVAFFAVAGFLVFVMVEGIVIFLGELAWSWVIRCRSPR